MATNDDKRVITIERAEHSSENPYFLHTRQSAQDRHRMSYEAIGVLSYLLSKPDGWKIIVEDIKTEHCGRDKVYRIFRELKAAGYLKRELTFGKGHRVIGGRYIISEIPRFVNQNTEKPELGIDDFDELRDTENPLHGSLVTGNLTLHNTESQTTDSKTGTSYQSGAESHGLQNIVLQTGNAVPAEHPEHKSNILVDALPDEDKARVAPAPKSPRLPPSPIAHRATAPSMIPEPIVLPTESTRKPMKPWLKDEDGEDRFIPPPDGISPKEVKEAIDAKATRQPTAKMIARDDWTRAVLRQFGEDQTFDYGADYNNTEYGQHVRDAKLLRQAVERYMAKNPGVTITSDIVDSMWGTKQNPGWLFRKDGMNLTREGCSTAVFTRYFLKYIASVSSPIVKKAEEEKKQALYANMQLIDPYAAMGNPDELAIAMAEIKALEAQRNAKKGAL